MSFTMQNEILKDLLAATGLVAVMASEEDDDVIELSAVNGSGGGRYAVVFDPLDGSRNIECSIPTGTIFGIYCVPGGAMMIICTQAPANPPPPPSPPAAPTIMDCPLCYRLPLKSSDHVCTRGQCFANGCLRCPQSVHDYCKA